MEMYNAAVETLAHFHFFLQCQVLPECYRNIISLSASSLLFPKNCAPFFAYSQGTNAWGSASTKVGENFTHAAAQGGHPEHPSQCRKAGSKEESEQYLMRLQHLQEEQDIRMKMQK